MRYAPQTVIKSFASKETERLWSRQASRKLAATIQRIARRKLEILDAAETIQDVRVPPSNHLEKLGEIANTNTAFVLTINGVSVSRGKMATRTMSKLWIIIRSIHMNEDVLAPIHPGEILLEEFLHPLGIRAFLTMIEPMAVRHDSHNRRRNCGHLPE